MPKIRKSDLTPATGSSYPPPHNKGFGRYKAWPFSDAAGLTQFGAFVETLEPGATSSQRHWHEAEDEFLYMLEGEITVVEDAGEYVLVPGEATGWKAGDPNGHQLMNRADVPATYLIVGTRAKDDRCHYTQIDMVYARTGDVSGYTHRDGTPYPKSEGSKP